MEATRISRLNPIIHAPARLGIMSVLAAQPELGFVELKSLVGLTDGNLSVHLRHLEDAGYVEITKSFRDRKPRTTVKIARKGKLAFEHYVEVLDEIVRKR